MDIVLNNIGKQYDGEWIFKSVSLSFLQQHCYLIAGGNGSGKSSLLKLLSGYSIPSQGVVKWMNEGRELSHDELHQVVSICAPSVDLFDKHTVNEAVDFHFKFKQKKVQSMSNQDIIELCYLEESKHKLITQLSSGMKQRLKLALAFTSNTPLLLLDEPCSNLDDQAIDWYQSKLQAFKDERLIVICSNNKKEEHFMCDKTINLANFKKGTDNK